MMNSEAVNEESTASITAPASVISPNTTRRQNAQNKGAETQCKSITPHCKHGGASPPRPPMKTSRLHKRDWLLQYPRSHWIYFC